MYERDGQAYPTYGAYLRSKRLNVDTGLDGRKAWDSELTAFADAKRQGIHPAGTRMHQINEAVRLSEEKGKAFDAGTGGFN